MMKAADEFHDKWREGPHVARRDVKWSLRFISLCKHTATFNVKLGSEGCSI